MFRIVMLAVVTPYINDAMLSIACIWAASTLRTSRKSLILL